jgi:hypothetical protein
MSSQCPIQPPSSAAPCPTTTSWKNWSLWSARKPRQQREKGLTLPKTSSFVCDREWERFKTMEKSHFRWTIFGGGQVNPRRCPLFDFDST